MTVAVPAPARSAALDFDALYRGSRDDVFAYVATLLHDRGAAEDVTALAFERAYRRRGAYDARRGSGRAWLFGIARNAALDELRRRGRTAPLAAEPAAVLGVSVSNAGTRLHRALTKLREVLDDGS